VSINWTIEHPHINISSSSLTRLVTWPYERLKSSNFFNKPIQRLLPHNVCFVPWASETKIKFWTLLLPYKDVYSLAVGLFICMTIGETGNIAIDIFKH